MKIALQVFGWVLISLQVLAYIGSANVGMSPLMLPFVGFIAYNIFGIIGVSAVYASKHVK